MLRITIVIPNYQSGPVLERAIRSILDEGYPNLQLIVADACSTDESAEIIERYADCFDPAIRRRDDGQVDALNYAFRQATGEIHGWLCADDELLPGSLAEVAAMFEQDPSLDLVVGGCQHAYPDGSTTIFSVAKDHWRTLGVRNSFSQPSMFWKAALHRRVGELDASYQLAFDWDFWCRMRDAGARCGATRRVLSRYHFSGANKSSVGGRLHVDEATRIMRRYGPFGGRIALVYRFIYTQFDLRGCMDHPPTCSRLRRWAFQLTWEILGGILGRGWMKLYNWHFASLQERGLDWWT